MVVSLISSWKLPIANFMKFNKLYLQNCIQNQFINDIQGYLVQKRANLVQ